MPPQSCCDIDAPPRFEPAEELAGWMRQTFIDGSRDPRLLPMWNEEHAHLKEAVIGVLWTNAWMHKGDTTTLGECRMPMHKGGLWQRKMAEQQLVEWFGVQPDFVLTFFGPYFDACTDQQACSVWEHELYHAAQKLGECGDPMFSQDGTPKFCIRPHDIEELTPVVSRYGVVDDAHQQFVREACALPQLHSMFDKDGMFAV